MYWLIYFVHQQCLCFHVISHFSELTRLSCGGGVGRDCLHKLHIDEELNPFWSDIEYAFLGYGFLPLWLVKRFKCIEVLSKWRLVLYARTRTMIRYQNFWYSKQNKLACCDHLVRVLPIWEKIYTHCLGQDILVCCILKQLFSSVSVNRGEYLPRRFTTR